MEFNSYDFKVIKEYLNSLLKSNKYFIFSEEQKNQIEEQIKCYWENDKNAFYKKTKLIKFPEFPWADIKKWLDDSRAKSLFEALIKLNDY